MKQTGAIAKADIFNKRETDKYKLSVTEMLPIQLVLKSDF